MLWWSVCSVTFVKPVTLSYTGDICCGGQYAVLHLLSLLYYHIQVTFAVVVSMQHYVGKPVTCWAPAHFKGGWIKFTNNFCWVKNTYHLPYEEHIPKEHESKREIIYYQWMPFILLFQVRAYICCNVCPLLLPPPRRTLRY